MRPNKFQEETERRERYAREDAWTIKQKDTGTFFSPIEVWCLSAPSVMKPEERVFVVDAEASMHMLSRKDLDSAVSKSPTTATTATGEVQTNEEATVYVKELDSFVTVKLLKDTPTVFSHGKLCDDHGHYSEWTSGQLPHLVKNGKKFQ